jgi:hypothetical protein
MRQLRHVSTKLLSEKDHILNKKGEKLESLCLTHDEKMQVKFKIIFKFVFFKKAYYDQILTVFFITFTNFLRIHIKFPYEFLWIFLIFFINKFDKFFFCK